MSESFVPYLRFTESKAIFYSCNDPPHDTSNINEFDYERTGSDVQGTMTFEDGGSMNMSINVEPEPDRLTLTRERTIGFEEATYKCELRVEREQEHRCREPTEGVNH